MGPREVAWRMLLAFCRGGKSCERCRNLGFHTGDAVFAAGVEDVLRRRGLLDRDPHDAAKLIAAVIHNDETVVGRMYKNLPELCLDVAFALLQTPIIRRSAGRTVGEVLSDFSPLAESAGVSQTALKNLILYTWRLGLQSEVDEVQEERRSGGELPASFRLEVSLDSLFGGEVTH